MSYEISKDYLNRLPILQGYSAMGHFLSGMIAETVSCVFWLPIDVVKERLQVQSACQTAKSHYAGSWDAIRVISRTEGILGLYKGYGATLASFGPQSAFFFMFYEAFKSQSLSILSTNELPSAVTVLCGMSAAGTASFITSPLDMAKLRIQVQRGNSEFTYNYRNVFHGVFQIAKHEGFRGLFRGASARMAFHVPSFVLTMTLYEEFKKIFATLVPS